MSQRMPPVQYIMTGVSGGSPASAAGTAPPVTSVGVSRNASCVLGITAIQMNNHVHSSFLKSFLARLIFVSWIHVSAPDEQVDCQHV